MGKKARVYLETTIPSYLTARPSRDLVRAAEQQMTRAWWDTRTLFDLYASQLVIDEVSAGDSEAAALRLEALSSVSLLGVTPDAESLGAALVAEAAVPANAAIDALHIAIAAAHGMDYLLTWNCKHIANAVMRTKIEAVCRRVGFDPPVICTPMELLEE